MQDVWSYKSIESCQSSSSKTIGLANVGNKIRGRSQVESKVHKRLVQYKLCILFHDGAGLKDRVAPADVDSFCQVRRATDFHGTIGVYFVNQEGTFIRVKFAFHITISHKDFVPRLIVARKVAAVFTGVVQKHISLSPILDCFPICDVGCVYDHVPSEYKLAMTGVENRVISGAETESNIL